MAEIIEQGIVLSREGSRTVVKIVPQGNCSGSCPGCSAFFQQHISGEFTAEADNGIDAQAGDRVKVRVKYPHFYKGLFLVFVLPVIALFLGYEAGTFIMEIIGGQNNLLKYVFMAAGLILSVFIIVKSGRNCKEQYTIVEKIKE